MNTCTMAELGRSPKSVCGERQPVLVTSNGKPQSIIINVSGLPVDDSVSLAGELHGRLCVSRMRELARQTGAEAMSDEEIQAEIDAVRGGRW